jgi:aminopeptidase N
VKCRGFLSGSIIFGRCRVQNFFFRAVAGLFLVVCSVGGACAREVAGPIDRQDISVTLEPEKHALAGETVVIYPAGTRKITMSLARSASVDAVKVDGKQAAFSFAGGEISTEAPPSSEPFPVAVSWHAAFNDRVASSPAAGEDPSYGVNGAITRDGTFLGDGAWWYPVPAEVPRRRSIAIRAPFGTEAITYGRRVYSKSSGNVTMSKWEESRPVGVLSLAAANYRIQERRVEGIQLYSYLYPANASLADRYLDAAERYLRFYSDLFGPYPFEKFAVVENFFPTGYGFPSFTLLGGSVIRLPFIVDTSFPHEIAHSWWGNGIAPDPREGNWSEGLVTYVADYLLKERRSPAEARDYRRQLLIDYASLVTPANEFPLREFASRVDPSSRAIGYGKGAMLFHMVRRLIGDDAFFKALRQVAHDHMYGYASWSDFVGAFSRSSGRDLSPFMQQWLSRPSGPRLSLSDVVTRQRGGESVVSGNIRQSGPTFELGVPLRLENSAGNIDRVVQVRGERTPFEIAATGKPKRLLLDPDAEIFRILTPAEIPATVNSIKGSRTLIGVITRNCRATSETFGNLLASLSQEQAPIIPEGKLARQDAGEHDIVFCGMPHDGTLLPALPERVTIAGDSFSVEGETFAAPDAAMLVVMKRPGNSGRFAALFQPLSEQAAAQYAPKITHYGKYGYLVFAGGGNRGKGTPAAAGGGTTVNLAP